MVMFCALLYNQVKFVRMYGLFQIVNNADRFYNNYIRDGFLNKKRENEFDITHYLYTN